jgi:hydrogenase 3 maturation protease
MNVLMGIGNTVNGDDGIGPWVATHLEHTNWRTINCGTVPENFTGVIKKWAPQCLVLVDTALMNLAPGEIRRIPQEKISTLHISTHSPPLSFLITHLQNHVQKMYLIGIQPKRLSGTLSLETKNGGKNLIAIIKKGSLSEIQTL